MLAEFPIMNKNQATPNNSSVKNISRFKVMLYFKNKANTQHFCKK